MPRFEQDPNGPPGSGFAVDDESGMRRRVFVPIEQQGWWTPQPSVNDVLKPGMAPAQPPAAPAAPPPTAAQPMRPQPFSGAPPPPPAAPPGTVLGKAELTPGIPGAPYDKAAEEQRGEALADETLRIDQQSQAAEALLNEQRLLLEQQQGENAKLAQDFSEKSSRYQTELDETVKREINPSRFNQNRGFMGTVLGLVGALAAFKSRHPMENFAMLSRSLDQRIERDIEAQREAKQSAIANMTRKLGSAQQAENHYRAGAVQFAMSALETRLKSMGLANQYSDLIAQKRAQADAYNEAARAASFGKPGEAKYTYEQPKPIAGAGTALPRGPIEQQLRSLGVSKEDYTKAWAAKLGGKDGNPSAGTTVGFINAIDQDIATLQTLTNKGVLPNKFAANQITDAMRGALQRLGVEFESDGSADLQKFNQVYTRRLIAEAKKMGGVITENDLRFTERVAGQSPQAILDWMQRMREDANRELIGHVNSYFPDHQQQIVDIMRGGQAGTTGIPGIRATSLGTSNNVAPADTKAPEPTETKTERENRERYEAQRDAMAPLRKQEAEKRKRNPRFGMPY